MIDLGKTVTTKRVTREEAEAKHVLTAALSEIAIGIFGGCDRDRTCDPLIKSLRVLF
jgi:hypothetical protein